MDQHRSIQLISFSINLVRYPLYENNTFDVNNMVCVRSYKYQKRYYFDTIYHKLQDCKSLSRDIEYDDILIKYLTAGGTECIVTQCEYIELYNKYIEFVNIMKSPIVTRGSILDRMPYECLPCKKFDKSQIQIMDRDISDELIVIEKNESDPKIKLPPNAEQCTKEYNKDIKNRIKPDPKIFKTNYLNEHRVRYVRDTTKEDKIYSKMFTITLYDDPKPIIVPI